MLKPIYLLIVTGIFWGIGIAIGGFSDESIALGITGVIIASISFIGLILLIL